MSTAIVLFTRDLRVHDHPALSAAVAAHDEVVPLFVLDDALFATGYAVPNRVSYLLDALRDLRGALVDRGASLVVRRGDLAGEVATLAAEVGADALHATADVSSFARRREARLRDLAGERGAALHLHPGVTVVPAGEVSPSGGDVFQVFSAYWRRWLDAPRREVLPAPERVRMPASVATGRLPTLADLVVGEPSPALLRGGETAARRRLAAWLAGAVEGYATGHDDLATDATSRLSADLHFGCVSANEVVGRLDRRRSGHDAFARQLCWRDHAHQLLWGRPDLPRTDLRPRGDRWVDDEDAVTAWKEGRTGYPVVDAGMRQLRREGWMHNRARMIVASFLTKHLRVDWRVGAAHFLDWLVDGDLANNSAQWQWVAGTGTDSRPNRMLNPWVQSTRYDAAAYIRRYVPELADLDDGDIHAPHELAGTLLGGVDYPPPIVDHREARDRFLEDRGVAPR